MTTKPKKPDPVCSHDGQLKVHHRFFIRRDIAEAVQIERAAYQHPWLEEEFIKCLRQRNVVGMVSEHGERVVGFMLYELHKYRIHILSCAVAADSRRRGVGRQMVDRIVGKLSAQRRTHISLEVRETNLDAQVFFRSCGFKARILLNDFYDDSPESAILMQYAIDDDAEESP